MRTIALLHRLRSLIRRTGLLPLRGVKVLATDQAGRVLLVRHRYGHDAWMLPGGGIHPWETPLAAGRRELREETGCRLLDGRMVARFRAVADGVPHPLFLVVGRTLDPPVPDGLEIAEASFFASLPADASPATRRRLAERAGGGLYPPDW